MLNIEYKILQTLSREFLNTDEIKSHFSDSTAAKIPYYMNKLEDEFLIEELCEKEISLIRQKKHYNDDSLVGDAGEFTGYYCLTDLGIECVEAVKEDRQRFWMPFVYSGAISLLSLVASATALILQLSGAV